MAASRTVEQILERQAKSFQLRRELATRGGQAARDALVHLDEGPWVSVSRQWGAGGQALAQELGRRLGWQVYDREILAEIAQHDPVRESILSRVENRAIGPFNDYLSHLIAGDPGQPAYLKEMMHVVWGLAKQGQAVIVGRGASWFLDARYGLRVRVVAPLDRRIEAVARRESIDVDTARKRVHDHDAQRRGFVRQVFNREIDDPLGYDMVLNVESLEPVALAEIVLEAVRAKLHAAG